MTGGTTPLRSAPYAGVFQKDDPVLEAWRELFRGGHSVESEEWKGEGPAPANSILLVSFGLGSRESERRHWVEGPGKKVLYIPRGGNNFRAMQVIQACRCHEVLDAISGDFLPPEPFLKRLKEFKERMERLCWGQPLYESLNLGHTLAPDDGAFIATPFEGDQGFEAGAEAALTGLGVTVHNPRKEYTIHERITEKIAEMINKSKLLAANMIHSPGKGFNPNVFYEMGFGQAKDKTILPFRPRGDGEAPIDVRDRDYIEYDDAIEVAMKLYWGLKPFMTNGKSDTRA